MGNISTDNADNPPIQTNQLNNKKINQFTLYSPQTDYEQFEQIVFELKKEIGLTMRLLTEFVNKSNVEKFNKIN